MKGSILEISTQSIKGKGHGHFFQEIIYSHFTCSLIEPKISAMVCTPGFSSKHEASLQASLTRKAINVSAVINVSWRR